MTAPRRRPRLLAAVLLALSTGRAVAQEEAEGVCYRMDYGPFLADTVGAAWPEGNVALKGVAIRLGAGGEAGSAEAGVLFDTEMLRMAAGWTGGFLELTGTPYDGKHGPHPRARGEQVFGTAVRPGWALRGSFDDPRPIPHGPLPREHGRYRGLYLCGSRVVLSYDVQGCGVLEVPGLESCGSVAVLTRTLELGPSQRPLSLLVHDDPGASAWVAPAGGGDPMAAAAAARSVAVARRGPEPVANGDAGAVSAARVLDAPGGARLTASEDGRVVLELPPHTGPLRFRVAQWSCSLEAVPGVAAALEAMPAAEPIEPLTHGGPARWGEVATHGQLGDGPGGYVVDTLTVPYDNPWGSRMRVAALDFFADGRAAVSTWNGDVWVVSGIDADLDDLRWRRFAAGLFAPLGLKIVDDVVHTLGRDQITRLHDLDGDGEADWYECFNNDVMITSSFHEFAFDLQTDPEGNFYFAKGGPVKPGGRGFDEIVPHHGCVLKVSRDGEELSVYATGLRAPNGIGVGPEGQVTSGDNEGSWTPRCRLNWIEPGTFCGCMDTAHRDPPPTIYDLPVCWMPMEVDNSSGGQVWVTSDRWGPFAGDLLHLSYGTCSLFKVLLQEVDGVVQGGIARFPVSFSSSCMRGRFHPLDGQLYVCGLKGWQTSAARLSALHRVRYTGRPVHLPAELEVFQNGLLITFTEPLARDLATDPESWAIEQWNYAWTERYGSPEISLTRSEQDLQLAQDEWNAYKSHDEVKVAAARLSEDGRTVFLEIEGLVPVMQMRIRYDLDAADGTAVRGEIHNSIHRVPARHGPRHP